MYVIKCPICQRKVTYTSRDEAIYRPFCTKRCKLIDLGRWLNEEYRVSEEVQHPEQQETEERPSQDEDPEKHAP